MGSELRDSLNSVTIKNWPHSLSGVSPIRRRIHAGPPTVCGKGTCGRQLHGTSLILWTTGDRVRAADIIRLKGDFELAQGQREQALATFQRALAILEKLGDHEETGVILSAMANDVTNQGKFDRGEQLYRESKSQFEQAGDRARVAVAIIHLGNFSYLRGDLRAASKLYRQSLEIQSSLDHPNLGEVLARLSDVELLLGHAPDARQYAQRAVEAYRPIQGDYEQLTKAMTNLGEALEAEGDLQGARQQFQAALEIQQKIGNVILVAESEEELADVAMEEGRADQAEPLLRTAIAEFEKDQGDPDLVSAYAELGRALLMEGKIEESDQAVQHAEKLGRTFTDLSLKLAIATYRARIQLAKATQSKDTAELVKVHRELNTIIAAASKSGYYGAECEARLVLGELEMHLKPFQGRADLAALASEARSRGLEAVARRAEQATHIQNGATTSDGRPQM